MYKELDCKPQEEVLNLKLLSIDGQLFYNMIISAANNLENNKNFVNSLNVFPVPDGDTGTNMSMTIMSAVREIKAINQITVESVSEAVANGSLMGARGNSGVILSQILRGIARGIKGKNSLNSKDFSLALKEGALTAYKAVMKPTEGTILTVAREVGEKAVELSSNTEDIIILMNSLYKHAKAVLDKTPDMLPVLKKAGVVDAGGMGFLCILEGMLNALQGNDVYEIEANKPLQNAVNETQLDLDQEIKYGYCTEFIIKDTNADFAEFREKISSFGDSLIVVGGSNIIKVHIHTNDPGNVISLALQLGELTKIKIDNMREQHRNILEVNENEVHQEENSKGELKKSGVITVASGEGIKNIFLDLGADKVIEGGQTMNPSTEDILNSINSINAMNIYILPNNSNIIMAAKQAATLTDKNVFVIPTKSIPQGISALTAFNADGENEENIEIMTSTMSSVKTGHITYAVRDTSFDGYEINEGDILGLINGKINNTGNDLVTVTEELIKDMLSSEDELITIFYGKDADINNSNKIIDDLKEKYKNSDIQLYEGGQPIYYYIISVE